MINRLTHAVLGMIVAATMLVTPAPLAGGQAEATKRLAGRLLVAAPQIADPMFGRSVIYMLRHEAGGALGLIVNQRVKEASFAELFELMRLQHEPLQGSLTVHFGGPVEPRLGFVLHTNDVMLDEHEIVAGAIAATTDPRMLEAIAVGRRPAKYLFVLGYAGWGPGQLEMEIARGDWAIIAEDADLIFASDPETTWERAMATLDTAL